MEKKTKVVVVGTLLGIILILLTIVVGSGKENQNIQLRDNESDYFTSIQLDSESVKDYERKSFTNIDVSDYLTYYLGIDNQIVLVGRLACMYCQIAVPILQNIIYLHDLDIYYLSTDDFTKETEAMFMESDQSLQSFSTPLLLIVSKGKIQAKISGLVDRESYITFFKENGFI